MQSYTLRFTQNYRIVLAIILPCLGIIPFILVMATWFPNLPEGSALTVIYLFLGLCIAATFFLIKKSMPRVQVQLKGEKLSFRFMDHYAFSPSAFELDITDIRGISFGYLNDHFSLKTARYPYRFNLSRASKKEEDGQQFYDFLETIAGKMAEREQ